MNDIILTDRPRPGAGKLYVLATLAMITSWCVFFSALILATWIFRAPTIPLRFTQNPAVVGMSGASRGSTIVYEFQYCRDTSRTLTLARELVRVSPSDHTLTPLPEVLITLDGGCHPIRMPMLIPASAEQGSYIVRLTFIDKSQARASESTTETNAFYVTN